jgi:transcription termination factor Rho
MNSDFINKTVKELREMAKARQIKNYSKLLKAQLVEALSTTLSAAVQQVAQPRSGMVQTHTYEQLVKKSVKDLKDVAKSAGVQGYYKLNKDALVSAILAQSVPVETQVHDEQIGQLSEFARLKVGELRDLAKRAGVKAYYKLKKDELVRELSRSLAPGLREEVVLVEEEPVVEPEPETIRAENEIAVLPPIEVEERREAYIDDILNEIQMPNVDKYLRNVNEKILQCLGMY